MAKQTNRQRGKQRHQSTDHGRRRAARKEGRVAKNAAPIEITITHVGGRGDGVGKAVYTHNHQSREHLVFVPGSLPGERILAQPLSLNTQGIRARIIELIEPAPDRNEPACQAFPACGGCQFQHWHAAPVGAWKQAQVETFLKRAKVWPMQIRPLFSVPLHSRRRATFHLKKLASGVVAGFNERHGPKIISPKNCVVLHSELLAFLCKLRTFAAREFPVGSSIDAQVNRLDQGLCVHIHFTGSKPGFEDRPALLAALGSWASDAGVARLSLAPSGLAERTTHNTTQAIPLYVPVPPTIHFGEIAVIPPAGSFLQASPEGEAVLQEGVIEGVAGAKLVADLFSGCGTLSLPLVSQGVQIVAVERDREALAALKDGADAAGRGSQVTCKLADLSDTPFTATDLNGFDAVILDPPRSGARAQCAALVRSEVTRIIMVSCNPATFARDAAILCDGSFCFDWKRVIDQFRMNNHIEMVAQFSRI